MHTSVVPSEATYSSDAMRRTGANMSRHCLAGPTRKPDAPMLSSIPTQVAMDYAPPLQASCLSQPSFASTAPMQMEMTTTYPAAPLRVVGAADDPYGSSKV